MSSFRVLSARHRKIFHAAITFKTRNERKTPHEGQQAPQCDKNPSLIEKRSQIELKSTIATLTSDAVQARTVTRVYVFTYRRLYRFAIRIDSNHESIRFVKNRPFDSQSPGLYNE